MDAALKRTAPLAGVVVVALEIIGGTLALKGAPGFSAKPAEIAAYFADPPSHIMLGIWLMMLAGPFWLIYVGCLYGAVKVKEDGIGRLSATLLVSGSAGVALGIAGDVFSAMAVIRAGAGTLTPTMATIYFDATNILSYTAMAMMLSVFSLALGLASFRYAVLPKWVGVVSILLAVVYVIPPISWVGVYIGLLVTLYVSVLLYRDKAGTF
jgi:hypothetical protein